MTDLTEQEIYIGSLMQQKIYLDWRYVKDICTKEMSEAYEQTKRENAQLKEQLESETLAKNEGAEIVAELQSKVKGYEELWYEANRRICMLTGLLVEAKECVEENLEFSKSIGRNRVKPRNKGLLKRIEKALKD